MKHTKGPWEVVDQYIKTEGGALIAEVHGYLTDDKPTPRPRPEAVANANLIAASPELLEALKIMVAQFSDSKEYTTFNAQFYACEIAREAIRKAEGKQ